jgi:hypothetical protein
MNKDQILGILRHVLTFAGGILVFRGVLEDALLQELVGGVVTLAGTVWSVISKKKETAQN